MDHGLEFLEVERAVIERGGEPESVFHQHLFAGSVPGEHAPDLRNRHVGFIYKKQKIFGEIIHERIGTLARLASGEVPGIILDPGAVSDFAHHLHVEFGAGFEALRFQQLAMIAEPGHALLRIPHYVRDGFLDFSKGGDEVFGGIDGHLLPGFEDLAPKGVYFRYPVNLIAEKFDPEAPLLVPGDDLHHVAPNAERAPLERDVVAGIMDVHQAAKQIVPIHPMADFEGDAHVLVFVRGADTVDAGDAGHDHDVSALQKGTGGLEAEAVNFLVDHRFFFDERVRDRQVRLGLIIVVVADEVFHRIFREEAHKFTIELGGQRFVVGDDERGFLDIGDDVRHRQRLSGAGHAEQGLEPISPQNALGQFPDRLGLVALGRIVRCEFERRHLPRPFGVFDTW